MRPFLASHASMGMPNFCWMRSRYLLGDDVEAAEGDDVEVGSEVVDVAALETLLVLDKDNSSEALEVFVASVELRILLAGGGIDQGV